MGFTPLEGLVMGTRSGDVDPGVLLYLLEEEKMSARELSAMLNKKSGLLGVSETSGRYARLAGEERSRRARRGRRRAILLPREKIYRRILPQRSADSTCSFLPEESESTRPRFANTFAMASISLGIHLDGAANDANAAVISTAGSRVKVRVIETNEDLTIVRHVVALLGWANA